MSAVWQSRKPKIPIRIGKSERMKEDEEKTNATVKLRAHFHSNQSLPHLDNFGLVLVLEWLLNIECKWFSFCLPLQYFSPFQHSGFSFNLLFICSPLTAVFCLLYSSLLPLHRHQFQTLDYNCFGRFIISIMICSCEFLWMV